MASNQPDPERFRKWGNLAGIGPLLAASVVAGYLLGRWLDTKLGTSPWLMLACVLLGTVAGFVELVRMVGELGDPGRKKRGRPSNPAEGGGAGGSVTGGEP